MTRRPKLSLALMGSLLAWVAVTGCPTVRGQEINGPKSIAEHSIATFSIEWDEATGPVNAAWDSIPPLRADQLIPIDRPVDVAIGYDKDTNEIVVPFGFGAGANVTAPPGVYTLKVHAVGKNYRPIIINIPLIVEAVNPPLPPTPEPPNPPGPGPTPKPPPAPTPTVDFGPVARVLILYESSDQSGLESYNSLYVRQALNELTPEDRYGTGPVEAWRVIDEDSDFGQGDYPQWSDALAKAKASGITLPAAFVFDTSGRMDAWPVPSGSEGDDLMIAKLRSYTAAKGGR